MGIGDNLLDNPPKPAGPIIEANAVAVLGVALNRLEAKVDSIQKALESLLFTGNLGADKPAPPVNPAPPRAPQTLKTSFYYKGGDGSFHNVTINPDNPICPICNAIIRSGKGKFGAYYYCSYDKIYFNESKKR